MYKNLGVPELVDQINEFQTDAEILEKEFLPKYKEVENMRKRFANGSLEQNKKNVDIYNKLAKEANNLQTKYNEAHKKNTK